MMRGVEKEKEKENEAVVTADRWGETQASLLCGKPVSFTSAKYGYITSGTFVSRSQRRYYTTAPTQVYYPRTSNLRLQLPE